MSDFITAEKLEEKRRAALVQALRLALTNPAEQRLFRSGKLDGLFSMRSGATGDAAALALRAGYLEKVRSEEKGKVTVDWVRIAPAGVEFLYEHDSPRAVLEEMQTLLKTSRAGVPAWMDGIISQLETIARRFADEMSRYLGKLDALTQRVEEAIRRAEAGEPIAPDPLDAIVPWATEILRYLDRRRETTNEPCPLPELFAAAKARQSGISLNRFHEGIKRLAERRAVKLLPAESLEVPQPEFALVDGSKVYFYVSR